MAEQQQAAAAGTAAAAPTISPAAARKHLRASLTLPTETDYLRHRAYKAGVPVPEIAAAENVSEEAVEESILLVRIDNAKFSPDEAGLAVRKLLLQKLPQVSEAISEALTASQRVGKKVQMVDKETGEVVTMEDFQIVPDHAARLRAVDATTKILSVVQPKDPQIQITDNRQVNTQTNILNAAGGGAGAGALGPGMNSPEEVIRGIVAQRRQALGDGRVGMIGEGLTAAPVPMSRNIPKADDADEDENEDEDIEDAEYEEDDDDGEADEN